MHRSLFGKGHETKMQEYYSDIKARLIPNEGSKYGYHFSPEDFYIYMIAHEYCHYLINGPLDGKLETSFWFEESICELASMFFLNRATIRWNAYQYVEVPGVPMSSSDRVLNDLKGYVKNNQEYLRNRE